MHMIHYLTRCFSTPFPPPECVEIPFYLFEKLENFAVDNGLPVYDRWKKTLAHIQAELILFTPPINGFSF